MTNRISIPASEVRPDDHLYDGPGTNAHPTFQWETITAASLVDGLVRLTVGRLEPPNNEFWFEPDEVVTVIRYPVAGPDKPAAKPDHKHGRGHRHG
ncbi:hypothetical protein J5J83_05215 [Azoarcus sp. L1K30]|uniref:hypothetical protein n=1 Tax=Azoarcus sp. L1K30 TaxID=2820277 RepID=UPI001B8170F3|nr:hypothetical protein [Azoarcus sp. L1K30]MBR0565517.1 hypothetical protein [Azoarcus sp. L1K30]